MIGHVLMLQDVTEQRRSQARLLEQQQTLAVLQERERLARELHDSLGQVLAAAYLQAKTAHFLLDKGQTAQVGECLGLLAETTLAAEADVRYYLLGAKSVGSGDRPFSPRCATTCNNSPASPACPSSCYVPPQLEAQGFDRAVEVQLMRIIQEALANVRKHAHARRAQVVFSQAEAQVLLAIIDDGCGFDAAASSALAQRYGLRAMHDRAAGFGGSLAVISSPGQGTRVVVQVPLARPQEHADTERPR